MYRAGQWKNCPRLYPRLIHLPLTLVLNFSVSWADRERIPPGLMYWKIALHVYEGVPSKWKRKGKGKKKTGKKSRFFPLNSLALCMWVWPWLRKSQCPARSFIVQFGRTHFRLNFFFIIYNHKVVLNSDSHHPSHHHYTHTPPHTHTSNPLPLKTPHPLTSSFPQSNLSSSLKLVSPRQFLINSKHVVFIQLHGSWIVWTLPWTWTPEVAAFREITFAYFNFLFLSS